MSRYVPISFNQYVDCRRARQNLWEKILICARTLITETPIYFGQGLMRDLIVEIGDAGVRSSFCDVKTRTGLLSRHLF